MRRYNLSHVQHGGRNEEGGKCGSLKLEVLESVRRVDNRIMAIGDDRSDLVVARKADVVFAKNDLLETCRTNDIRCHEFTDFADILSILDEQNGTP